MRTRLFAIGLAVLSAALVACGGGGSGNNNLPPPPRQTGPPTPSPTPAFFSQYPASAGDTFSYSGTFVQADAYAQPTPSPLPSTSVAASIAQSITVSNAAANPLNGKPASDFHATQNTAYPTKTSVLTSDTYYAYAGSASAANLVEYGFKSADSLKNTISYAYATPQIVAELPFAQNAAWSNSAAVAISETDADGTTSTRTYNADGSYTDTEKFFYGDADITQNADGSGIYTSPVFLSGLLGAEQTFRFNAPSNGQIVVTGEFPPPPTPTPNATGQPTPTPNPTIAPTIVTIPAWYAAGQKLYTETDTDGGSAAIPASCSVPAKIGSQGEKLVQTISRLDTILGFAETQTTTSYVVPNFGPACIVMNDVTKDYYDYQGDTLPGQNTTGFFAYYSAPYHTTTIDETLTLQSATIQSAGRTTESSSTGPIAPAVAAAGRTEFLWAIEHRRRLREKAFITAVRRYTARKGARK